MTLAIFESSLLQSLIDTMLCEVMKPNILLNAGALSSQPLDSINAALTPEDANYAAYENWGQEILATAVLAIFVTAPIGLLIINMAGPKLLTKV
jgi:hypothetical protein